MQNINNKNKKRFSVPRGLEIYRVLLPVFFKVLWTSRNTDSFEYKKSIENLRDVFQYLGTTFIKLGQLLSARPDLVGAVVADTLRSLLDHQPSIPFSTITEQLKNSLGVEWEKNFSSFDKTPLSNASIGQVHKAKLKQGEVVAVKIQHPQIKEEILRDLLFMGKLTKLFDFFLPKSVFSFSLIFEEFSEWIRSEIDFRIEAKKIEKFASLMKHQEGINSAKVFWEYSTETVLTTSFFQGMNLNTLISMIDSQQGSTVYSVKLPFKINPDLLIKRLVSALLHQILVDKYFHGDLHPANIILQPENKIAFVDFGITGILNNEEHNQLLMILLSFVDNDPESMISVLLSASTNQYTREEQKHLYQQFSHELHKVHQSVTGDIGINHFLLFLLQLSHTYSVVWSSGLLLAAKTLAQVDSITNKLGVKTSVINMLQPNLAHYVTTGLSTKVSKETLLKNALELIEVAKHIPDSLREFEEILHQDISLRKRSNTLPVLWRKVGFTSMVFVLFPFVYFLFYFQIIKL